MKFDKVFLRSNVIDRRVRVKLTHFIYFKGGNIPVVSSGCPMVYGDYLNTPSGL